MKQKLLLLFAVLAMAVNASADNTVIYYTSSDGNVINPNVSDNIFGANIISNTYEDGQGMIVFDGDVTKIGGSAFLTSSRLTSMTIPETVISIEAYAFKSCSALTEVNIPNKLTTIGLSAFQDCSSLTSSVVIPNTVTSIGNYAFARCSVLTSVTIGNSVETIGDYAFSSCSKLTSVTIPDKVTTIGASAFSYCYDLKSVKIPESVTSIGTKAFNSCTSLTSIEIPDKVTTIEEQVCYNCSTMTSVKIPSSITSIGASAFYQCKALTSVTIPSKVTSIGEQGFYNCKGLTSVTIPSSVTSIGKKAFYGCSNLKEIISLNTTPPTLGTSCFSSVATGFKVKVPGTVVETYKSNWSSYTIVSADNQIIYYTSSDGDVVTPYKTDVFGANITSNDYADGQGMIVFDADVTSIGNNAFYDCSSLTSVEIPNSVTSIEAAAFSGCSHLSSFTGKFASSDNRCLIDNNNLIAFAPAELTSYTIPNSVTSIGNYAFAQSKLTKVTIPSSVTSIGNYAFYNCTNLKEITSLNTTAPTATENTFTSVDKNTCKVIVPNATAVTSYKAATGWSNFTNFINAENLIIYYTSSEKVEPYDSNVFGANITSNTYEDGQGMIVFDGEVTSIGDWAFNQCKNMTSVTIPNSVTTIGEHAFGFCENLKTIDIPSSVTSIGNSAFGACYELESVTISGNITSIRNNTFNACWALTSLTIPESVTSIGDGAFMACNSLESVNIPDNVTSIGENAFDGCSELTSLTIPNKVTTIANAAFSGCTGLTSLTISGDITSIGENAFQNCSGLTSVEIGDHVTSIGVGAFYGCYGLTTMSIGSSVETIGDYAFYKCSGIKSITIPASVTTIGESAFFGCGLTTVEIPNTVTSMNNNAFNGCSSLESFTGNFASADGRCLIIGDVLKAFAPAGQTSYEIPSSYAVTSIGDGAFSYCNNLESVIIPECVTTIGESAFFGCGLTTMMIPNSVTSIGYGAFTYCDKLESVTIGNSVETIGNGAFENCTSLSEITSLATTPPSLGDYCFYNVNPTSIKVPKAAVNTYKEAKGWSDYADCIFARSQGVTISPEGLATLWLEYDATIPTGVEVYYASSCSDSKVTITKISGDVLPRETGVIVKGTASGSYTFEEADTEGTKLKGDNLLVGSATEQTLNDANYKYYKLTYNNEGNNFGFYLANAEGTIETAAHRAYLRLTKSSSRGISIDWGDGTTEMEGVVERRADSDTMYNLQGMPVSKGYKGIVVKGGRKIMMK